MTTRGAMTEIAVELGCDCRISTSFVGARYLALDIADRDAARRRAAVRAGSRDPAARAEREATAVATAEELLIRQIERAAGQGLVELALTAPDAARAAGAPRRSARPRAGSRAAPPPAAPGAERPIAAALDGETRSTR